jgi:hypothetical protein
LTGNPWETKSGKSRRDRAKSTPAVAQTVKNQTAELGEPQRIAGYNRDFLISYVQR